MMAIIIKDETTDQVSRTFASLADSTPHKYEHVNIERTTFVAPSGATFAAIHLERPWRADLHHLDIVGEYTVGVELFFSLYAKLNNVSIRGGAPKGFYIGNGQTIWPDATTSNSASNQSNLSQCRFHGEDVNAVGFHLDGGTNVTFQQCTVEGQNCDIGWLLYPKSNRGLVRLQDCWLETVNGVKTAIRLDGYNTLFIIDGLNIVHMPQNYLINGAGDQNSKVVIQNCNWTSIPPCRFDRSTEIEMGPGNSFTQSEFFEHVEWVG